MSGVKATSDRLQQAFAAPANTVVGLVDEVLATAREQSLVLTWVDGDCLIEAADSSEALLQIPMRKPIFRAALARVAVLPQEQGVTNQPGTPYEGEGRLPALDANRPALDVAYVNTQARQSLTLTQVRPSIDSSGNGRAARNSVSHANGTIADDLAEAPRAIE